MTEITAEMWEKHQKLMDDCERRNTLAWAKPKQTHNKIIGTMVLFFVGVVGFVLMGQDILKMAYVVIAGM